MKDKQQWKLSITDTIWTNNFVLYSEVSLTRVYIYNVNNYIKFRLLKAINVSTTDFMNNFYTIVNLFSPAEISMESSCLRLDHSFSKAFK